MKSLNKTQTNKLNSFETTSAKIRYLNHLGFERGPSAKILGIKYQWVKNVLDMKVKTPKEKFK